MSRKSIVVRLRCFAALGLVTAFGSGCASLPKVEHTWHEFPVGDAFVEEPHRPYQKIGTVRARVDFPTLDAAYDESKLCKNYYNKAVRQLVDFSRAKGGDAVVAVRSVVFLMNGRSETHPTPECVDEGGDGQILVEGIAIKWNL